MTILIGLMLGMFLSALDQTIVVAAARTIGDDLNGLSLQAWITTAYLVASTITTPVYGKLGDLFGRRRAYLSAIALFLAGSIACSSATTMSMLTGFRVLQGLGAGGIFSLALAIIGDIASPRERARYQGYTIAVFGLSSVIGPVLGGFFAGADQILGITGWRWVFLINLPVGVVAFAVVAVTLQLPAVRRGGRIDYLGAVLLTVGLVPLLTVLEQGREWGWWAPAAKACYGGAAVGLLLFVVAQHRARDDALMPLRFFHNGSFTLLWIVAVLVGAGMFGGLAVLPLYLQIVRGAGPGQAGLMALPLSIGLVTGSVVSSRRIARTGRYKIHPIIGTAAMIAGMWLLHTVGVDTPLWQVELHATVLGLGLGVVIQTLTLAVQATAGPRDIGVVTASVVFSRQVGAIFGTAAFLSLLFSTLATDIGTAFGKAGRTAAFREALGDPGVTSDPRNAPILALLRTRGGGGATTIDNTSFLATADPRLTRPLAIGFSESIDRVFLTGALVLVAALVLLVFVREIPLRADPVGAIPLRADPVGAMPADARSNGVRPAAVDALPLPRRAGSIVSGRVGGPDGASVAGATVSLMDLAGRRIDGTRSGPDGGYTLDTGSPGSYLLICAAPGYRPAAAMVAAVEPAVLRDLALARANSLSGRVPDPETAGNDLTVILTDTAGHVVAATTASPDGSYFFEDVRPGDYLVGTAGQERQASLRWVSIPERDGGHHGPGTGGGVDQPVELAGRVRLAGIGTAHAFPAWVLLTDSQNRVALTSFTAPDGTFRFGGVTSGTYTLIVAGPAPVARRVDVHPGRPQLVDIVLGEEFAAEGHPGNGSALDPPLLAEAWDVPGVFR
jgi:EmrB/QacA subfamily drug resistance transporter